jgi:hypothetical protein
VESHARDFLNIKSVIPSISYFFIPKYLNMVVEGPNNRVISIGPGITWICITSEDKTKDVIILRGKIEQSENLAIIFSTSRILMEQSAEPVETRVPSEEKAAARHGPL